MKNFLLVFTVVAAGCADLDTSDDTEVEGDPTIYATDGAIDEDMTADMVEFDMPDTLERSGLHRIHATPANLSTFRHGCYTNHKLDWDCGSNVDGHHASFSHKRETGSNDTEVADNFGGFMGECVSLVKAATKNNAVTSTWRPGADAFAGLSSGTAIATFPGGRYSGHTAILLGYVKSGGKVIGIRVADENWLSRDVKRHIIRRGGSGVSNADNYSAVLVP